jgi:hypothetical protein
MPHRELLTESQRLSLQTPAIALGELLQAVEMVSEQD